MYSDRGTAGEKLIGNFFDKNFSRIFSFPNAKTKSNAQVADVLVWMNRTVFLVEVKTRDDGTASINSWAESRICDAVEQLSRNYQRIKAKEQIFLNNAYYHTHLDCKGISQIIGLIVLVHEENCDILPSQVVSNIYKQEMPIHIFSNNQLINMTDEIDTIPDFIYYLNDRYKYLKISDIPLNRELDVLGYYKSQSNSFPQIPLDLDSKSYWSDYRTAMTAQIQARDTHNEHSLLLDKIENVFTEQRKLFDGLPSGLYYAWEIGSMSRRERAYLGEKLDKVQDWFEPGKSSRRFAWCNMATGNWLVFYFSKSKPQEIRKSLTRIVELKLIKEVHWNSFDFAVYGFGFQISVTYPTRLLGLATAIAVGASEVKGKYSNKDLEDSQRIWGTPSTLYSRKIEEFPSD